jgi:hypothetical protein
VAVRGGQWCIKLVTRDVRRQIVSSGGTPPRREVASSSALSVESVKTAIFTLSRHKIENGGEGGGEIESCAWWCMAVRGGA